MEEYSGGRWASEELQTGGNEEPDSKKSDHKLDYLVKTSQATHEELQNLKQD
jgi:hypothetical protein